MNKMKKVPEIRFKEFAEDWENTDASIIFKTYFDKNHPDLPVLSASQEYGMIIREDVGFKVQHNKENEAGYKRVLPGQFVIHLRSFQGGFAHSDVEGITSPAYTIIEFRDKSQQDDIFWKYVLTSKEFIKRLETVTYGIRDGRSISFEDFSELGFNVPDIKEQRKIGKTLTVIDTLIRKLEQKLEKLRNIKQSLINQMFVNVNRGGYAPLIRFKGYADKWIMVLLKDVSKKVTEKNSSFDYKDVFTNSAELGIINQRDYFDHDVANVESIQGYYKVAPNDYVYNPRISTSAPVGPINRNKLAYGGVMSPLYYVFRVDDKDFGSLDFLDFFFKSDVWHEFMFKNGNSGARSDRFSISEDVFVEMPIAHPKSKREQKTIGNFLASMDAALQNETYKLTKLRTMKQSLLQKMFV